MICDLRDRAIYENFLPSVSQMLCWKAREKSKCCDGCLSGARNMSLDIIPSSNTDASLRADMMNNSLAEKRQSATSTSSFQRIPSESSLLSTINGEVYSQHMPCIPWQRSQSALDLENKEAIGCHKVTTVEYSDPNKSTGAVSEHSKVYLDLSKAEDEIASAAAAAGWTGGKFKISLQTIHQKEEMKTTSAPSVSIQARVVRRMSSETGVYPVNSDQCEVTTSGSPPPKYEEQHTVCLSPSASGPLVHTKTYSFITYNQLKPNMIITLATAVPMIREQIQVLRSSKAVEQCTVLRNMLGLIKAAWAVPSSGRDIASRLCDVLREEGGLEILIENCSSSNYEVQLNTARVLEQSMTVGNRDVVARRGLEVIVRLAKSAKDDLELTKATTGILENLFKHSENTCARVIRYGGLDTILYSCRTRDKLTLRHCAIALANLAIFGGTENQYEMILQKVPEWLFPLAFSNDDSIRYYAFLAISMLSANKEISSAVAQSGTLELVEPFICTHNPLEFAHSDTAHIHGQSAEWLRRLVPLLYSSRKEATSLAAFHFAMEAGIKLEQGKVEVFNDIGAVEPLRSVASSPNKLASKFATQALDIMGEEIPYKLSPQVPLWTTEDVIHWLQRIAFAEYTQAFSDYQVDGDLLLTLVNESLRDDLKMNNGITRKRFLRELGRLKESADYQSCDPTKLDAWLKELGHDFCQHSYSMLKGGADRCVLRWLTDEQLHRDCGIENGIHRMKIIEASKRLSQYPMTPICMIPGIDSAKTLDCFISYRRATGSQLASLLKVHLQVRGFSVFLDIEKLRAGKFDDNLLNSVRNARNFILVLTPNSLDRCVADNTLKDWVHREIVAALEGGCNIIPVMDNFQWPLPETLPDDMRPVCFFNGIRWIHDYQDACVDKLEKFISGELSTRSPTGLTLARPSLSKASSLSSAPNSIHGPGARDVFRKATSASFDSLMSPPGCRDSEKPVSKLC